MCRIGDADARQQAAYAALSALERDSGVGRKLSSGVSPDSVRVYSLLEVNWLLAASGSVLLKVEGQFGLTAITVGKSAYHQQSHSEIVGGNA
jgi:hypothetical protein